ncbi:MAG: hypothetical protein Q9170_008258 [Blastenia crenularia]
MCILLLSLLTSLAVAFPSSQTLNLRDAPAPAPAPPNCNPPSYPPSTPDTCGAYSNYTFHSPLPGSEGYLIAPDQLRYTKFDFYAPTSIVCGFDTRTDHVTPESCRLNLEALCDTLAGTGDKEPPRGKWITTSAEPGW